MKKSFLLLLLYYSSVATFAQYKVGIDGLLAKDKDTVNTVNIKYADTAHIRFNEKARKVIFKELLHKVEMTISNMDNDSLRLWEQYDAIYCNNFFCRFYADMIKVRDSLRKGRIVTNSLYFPGIQLKSWLDTAKLYKIETEGQRRYKVIYINKPFNLFIYNLYRDATWSDILGWQMDMQYKNAWRQMEFYYKQGNHWLDSLNKASGTVTNCNSPMPVDGFISNMHRMMSDSCLNFKPATPQCAAYSDTLQKILPLLYQVKDTLGIPKWLWYTGGIVTMNPLAVTTPNRRYPATEKWTVLDTSLVNSYRRADTDSAFKDFLTAKRLWNDIELPNCNGSRHVRLIEYYADSMNTFSGGSIPAILTRRDSIKLWVYNMPVTERLSIARDSKSIPNVGSVTSQLNDALDVFPTAVIGATIGSNLANILNNINSKNKPIVPTPSDAKINGKDIKIPERKKDISRTEYQTYDWSERNQFKEDIPINEDEELDFLFINGQKISFKKEANYFVDKRNIIYATYTFEDKKCSVCKDTLMHYVVDSFVIKDYCKTLDYSKKKIIGSIKSLIERFNEFLGCVRACNLRTKEKMLNLAEIQKYLSKFMAIPNRSFPPDTLDIQLLTDTRAQYTTAFFQEGMPDSSLQNSIKVSKTVRISGKDSVILVKQLKFKTGKVHYVDASAGLAITTTEYRVAEQSGSGLPTTKAGDRIKLNAGIHIYPFGYVKIDDRLLPKGLCDVSRRVSLYLGVSISSKPLDNLYTGAGYDIVPGIRLIAGSHWFKDTRYQILNNQVFNKADGYKPTFFMALNLEPLTLTKALGIIK